MKRSTIDLSVGIFVLIGILSMVFLALKVANLMPQSAQDTYTVYANFNNIGGLKVKAPIKASGVVVGRVSAIQLDTERYLAKVALTLDKQYPFSTDASVEILTSGLLGEQYIGIMQGAEIDNLKEGDTISLTSSALVLEQLIGKFMTNMSSGSSEQKDTPASDSSQAQ